MKGVTSIILMLVIVVLVVGLADRSAPRFDLTREATNSLAPQTLAILAALDTDVAATALYRPEDMAAEPIRKLLDRFAAATPRFSYEIVDPDRYPGRVQELGVSTYGATVVERNGQRAAIFNYGENDLAVAIRRLVREKSPVVRFTTGFGEKGIGDAGPDGYSVITEKIRADGLVVEELLMPSVSAIPESTDLIVVAGPTLPFTDRETDLLEAYIRGGGRVLSLIDPFAPAVFEVLPGRFGMELGRNVVVDRSSRLYGADIQMPVVISYDLHEATRGIRGTTLFPHARSVGLAPGGGGADEIRSLLTTSNEAWGETNLALLKTGKAVFDEGVDQPGPLSLGMIASVNSGPDLSARRGRLAVFGDSDFPRNRSISHGANADLFLNLVNWMASEEAPLGIRSPGREDELLLLTVSQGRRLFWISVVMLPGLVALAGIILVGRWRWGA